MKPMLFCLFKNNVSKIILGGCSCFYSSYIKGEHTLIHSTNQEHREDTNGYNPGVRAYIFLSLLSYSRF